MPTNRIKWLTSAAILILICAAAIFAVHGRPRQKTYRVGIVSGSDIFLGIAEGFTAGLAELGYAEHKNIEYTLIRTNVNKAAARQAAEKLVRDKVDLIFAFSTEAALEAKKAINGTNIPLLFAMSGVKDNNLIETVPRPGGNTTGSRYPGPELTVKRLEMLKQCVEGLKKVLILYEPNYPMTSPSLKELHTVAPQMNITLLEIPVHSEYDIKTSLERLESTGVDADAVLIMPEILTQTSTSLTMIIGFADRHKIPVGGCSHFGIGKGAMFTYSPHHSEVGKLCAKLAAKILAGHNAGDLMVVTPPVYLHINYKKAQELGIKVPEGLLNQACEITR